MLTEEQLKEIEARHAAIFGPDFVAAERATDELARDDVPALIAEIRRLRSVAAAGSSSK